MTDIFGRKLMQLSEDASPLGAFSKMCLELFPTLTPFSKTWKIKDTPGKRSLFRLAQSTPRIKGKGSGLLPTPTASDATSGQIIGKNDTYKITANNTLRKYSQTGNNSSLTLGRTLIFKIGSGLLPTPQASDNRSRGNLNNPCIQRRAEMGKQIMLSMVLTSFGGKTINPQFLEWMMGYPMDWTEINH